MISLPAPNLKAYPPTNVARLVNLALAGVATAPPGYDPGHDYPGRVNDGDTGGNYYLNGVFHSDIVLNPYLDLTLPAVHRVLRMNIFNRTDCCGDRLSNYYLFVSRVPFPSSDLAATIANPQIRAYHQTTQADGSPIPINAAGRYFRIQLNAFNYLHFGEMQIWGW